MNNEKEFCIECDRYVDEDEIVYVSSFDCNYECCKRCKEKRFVYCEEVDCWYDTYTYLTSIYWDASYKEINRRYGNIKNYIGAKTTKKEIKEMLIHFGYRIKNFNKIKKADIIDVIMKSDL